MTASEAVLRLRQVWVMPTTAVEWLTTVDHKRIGVRYIATSFTFFLLGGILALLIRTQLGQPQNDVLGPEAYNRVFTMHGTTMVFLFATPMVTGLGIYFMPLMLGTRDMAFPRLNALGYWVVLLAGLFIYSSFLAAAPPDVGWFAYPPLSSQPYTPGLAADFYALGVIFIGISTTIAAINFITTALKLRAPGMGVHRVPLFIWGIFDAALTMLVAVPALTLAAVLLELDRKLGTHFYNPEMGGTPLLWQHLFWFWGHPEVYILLLPALGIVSTVIAAFSRRTIMAYSLVVTASLAISILSFSLWVHHMFSTGLSLLPISFFTASSFAISIASGITIFAWLGTIWYGKNILKTPMMFALGFIVTFVLGGITGVMVASVPFDWQVHDTFFVVAHFHYVLVGGVVFPIFAALYHWFPKVTGRMYHEAMGHLSFWLIFIGFNVTFFPQHILGFLGMPRRVYTYLDAPGWGDYNLLSTAGSYILGAGILVLVLDLLWSLFSGRPAGNDPWQSDTLEWATTSPPPEYNFQQIPVVDRLAPLWEDTGQHPGRRVDTLEAPLVQGRQVVTTSILDAAPERVINMPASSYTPAVLAVGVLATFIGILTNLLIVLVIGVLTVATSLAVWLWRSPLSSTQGNEALPDTGPPQRLPWTGNLSQWGIILFVIAEAIIFLELIVSYFVIRVNVGGEWPPGGISPPELLLPGILTAIIVASSLAIVWADRNWRRDRAGAMRLALVLALVLALGFLFLQGYEYSRKEFTLDTNAYGSLFYVITGTHGAHVALGILMMSWVLARSLFAPVTEGGGGRALPNLGIYWHFVGVVWLVIFSVLYIGVRWL